MRLSGIFIPKPLLIPGVNKSKRPRSSPRACGTTWSLVAQWRLGYTFP